MTIQNRVWLHTVITGVAAAVSLLGPVMTAAGDERQVSATYVFDPPNVDAAGVYSRVSMKGCAAFHRVGMPDVPFRTGRLLLPPDALVESIGVELLDEVRTLDVSRPVAFGRTPLPIGIPGHAAVARAAQDKPDPATYAADIPYPASRLQLVSVQKMNGYSIAIVRVFPVQYLPASGTLLYCPRLRVNVTLAATAAARVSAVPLRRFNEPQLRRVLSSVDNPEAVATYETTDLQRAQPLTTYDYLLVTTAALTNSFQPLVQQKIADGLSVKVMTVESVLTGFTGVDDAAKLRSCITYAYTNWNTSYVLLGGDTTTVPYRQAYAFCLEADATMPCDLYFACLDGSWNADGDAYWGEPTDGEGGGDVDLLAEVYVGRAPVDNAAEVSNFVGKTLHYEQSAHANAGRVRLLAEYLGNYDGSYAQSGDGLDRLLPAFSDQTVDWLDDRPTNAATWSAADCVAALNQSPHLVAHDGHANETYALRMGKANIDGLTNTEPFLLNSLGCECGAFDFSDCFAEELVKRNAYGAFSVLMNSRYGWFDTTEVWVYSGEFMKGFFDSLLVHGRRNIGVANQLSKQDMIGSVETSGDMVYRWCYFEITLFGDPHTVLQMGDPLLVSPGEGFRSMGPEGGPFAPASQTYALTNEAASAVSWTATSASGLVSLSSVGGTLPSGGSAAVTVSLAPGTGDLPEGLYTDEVTFSNCVSGVSRRREVSLLVGQFDFLTELFAAPKINDLAYQSFTFRPNGSTDFYWVSRKEATVFPTSPSGGAHLSLSDDGFAQCSLSNGVQVSLFGISYASFFVGANGFVTFGSGDGSYSESLSAHFSKPRVAALFDDLLPGSSTVSWLQLSDKAVITYQAVPEVERASASSFQIELFFNGTIRITYLGVSAADGLAGLSRGEGVPAFFSESDFSAYGPDIPEAVDNTTLVWTTSASQGWVGQGVVSHDGVDAARSGAIGNRQETWLETQVTGPGDASFWWRVSSEADWDWLEFYVDGALADRISGETGWLQKIETLTAGTHTLRWRYVKDGADIDPVGQDCGWVDAFIGPSQSVLPSDWLVLYGLPNDGSADYADSDGDGMPNWDEWVAGTVPTNGLSLLKLVWVAGTVSNGFHVSWQSVPGKQYWVGSSETLAYPIFFTPFVSNVLGQAGSTDVLDTRPVTTGKRFYRVGVQQE